VSDSVNIKSDFLMKRRRAQGAELQLAEREADQAALGALHEQLRDAKHKLTEMLHAYHRAAADRDDGARLGRAAAAQLAQHKLVVAHVQRHLDRARRENARLRSECSALVEGRPPAVRCAPARQVSLVCAYASPSKSLIAGELLGVTYKFGKR
jgi:hypothetical protein